MCCRNHCANDFFTRTQIDGFKALIPHNKKFNKNYDINRLKQISFENFKKPDASFLDEFFYLKMH